MEPSHASDADRAALRILVVDDNEDAADSLALILQLEGSDVRTAHDGYSAESVAAEFLPHVILLDLGMPKRDGLQVARRIRGQPWGAAMRLVAVTGYSQREDRQRCMDAGIDACLIKPVDYATLSALLATFQCSLPSQKRPLQD